MDSGTLDQLLESVDRRLGALEATATTLNRELGEVKGAVETLTASQQVAVNLIKFVITPLIVIVGALVGIKIAL